MSADQGGGITGDSLTAAARRRRFELRAEFVASLGAAGVVLYVLLRFPFAIFYGRLGTSPEEIGLGYVQLLAQSSVLVAVVAGFAAIISTTTLMALFMLPLIFQRPVYVEQHANPPLPHLSLEWDAAAMSDDVFESRLDGVRRINANRPWVLLFLSGAMPVMARTRDLQRRAATLSDAERREQRRLNRWPRAEWVKGFEALWRGSTRFLVWSFLIWSLIIMLLALPLAAVITSDTLARTCRSAVPLPAFDSGQSVQLLSADTMAPAFIDRELLLLGGESSRYVLFDCRGNATLRLPASNYVVIHTG